jgi:hypothetical protein
VDSVAAQTIIGPGYPFNSTRWGLFATQGAVSMEHVDAGGFYTWVRILAGCKDWFTATLPEPLRGSINDIDLMALDWNRFLLQEDDIL